MPRTVDVSGWPALVFQYVLAGFYVLIGVVLVALLGAGFFESAGVTVTVPGHVAVATGAVVWMVTTFLFGRRAHGGDINWRKPVSFADEGENLLAFHHWRRAIEWVRGSAPDDEGDGSRPGESES